MLLMAYLLAALLLGAAVLLPTPIEATARMRLRGVEDNEAPAQFGGYGGGKDVPADPALTPVVTIMWSNTPGSLEDNDACGNRTSLGSNTSDIGGSNSPTDCPEPHSRRRQLGTTMVGPLCDDVTWAIVLQCPAGMIISSIDSAFFGRSDTTTCPYKGGRAAMQNTACRSQEFPGAVVRACVGKPFCILPTVSDPCYGTYKWRSVSFSCVNLLPAWGPDDSCISGLDLNGKDIRSLQTSSNDACRQECDKTPTCVFSVRTTSGLCFLKSSPFSGPDGMNRGAATDIDKLCWKRSNIRADPGCLPGVDFKGTDVSALQTNSRDDCKNACNANTGCTFSVRLVDGRCFLKTSIFNGPAGLNTVGAYLDQTCVARSTPSVTPTSSGCPVGWLPAVGTLYDSWPKPGSPECDGFNGCSWAGQFQTADGGSGTSCINGAQYINDECRFPEATVKAWRVAATADTDRALLGRKLEVMVQNGASGRTTKVNVIDVCSDAYCDGCCSQNTGNGKWKLIDIEKWPAYELLNNFNPNDANFDIGDVDAPMAGSLRSGAPGESVMALCYRDAGKCDVAASSVCK